jgi:hypothetical protein
VKLVRLVEMCLNETSGRVCVGKHLSDTFSITNGLGKKKTKGCLITSDFYLCFRIYHCEGLKLRGLRS